MTDGSSWKFSVVDFFVLGAVLGASLLIGIISSFRGNKSPEAFLMGNRSFSSGPVSMSLLCSFVSAVNIMGFTSEVYSFGSQLFMMMVGCVIGIGLSITITLPVIFPLKMTSVHEYMELRFNSKNLQLVMMLLIYFNALVFMGVCLYATSIALAAIAPLHYITFILIMGVVCTLYSTIGGIRAVVWTDVFQLVVMSVGLSVVIGVGVFRVGGFARLYQISTEGRRFQLFNMNPSIYERHTFFNTIVFGTFIYAALFGISQINIQRICAVPTLREAKIVLCCNMVGTIIIHCLIFLGGLVVYTVYAGCDPLLSGKIQKRDEILSYFIVDQLSYLYGLPGIFVATLVASTLSTFSSVVNAQVAILWKDCFHRLKRFREATPATAAFINKILTFMTGGAFIGMAILTSKAGSIIQLALTVGGIIFGSIYGVFLLGMCFPRSNLKGAWSGLLVSISFLVWIYAGASMYGTKPKLLPFTTDFCGNYSESSFGNGTLYEVRSQNSNSDLGLVLSVNETEKNEEDDSHVPGSYEFGLLYLYDISYTLYSLIAPFVCVVVGITVSYVTGPTKMEDTRPELITPLIRKMYGMKVRSPKESAECHSNPAFTLEMSNVAMDYSSK